jgi:hypothetical protein
LGGGSKGPLSKAISRSPLPGKGFDASKLNLESLTSTGKKVGSVGQQVGEIATAVEDARRKSK